MPIVQANGAQLYFETMGTGRRLLLFNGTGSSIESTRPLLTMLAKDFELAVHDQRGLGQSSVPPGPFTMQDYALDGAALLDHLGWDTARVMGISFGGMVAQELAVTFPDRVDRLALLCTSPGGRDRSSFPLQDLARLPDDERIVATLEVLDARFTGDWLANHPTDQAIVAAMAERAAAVKDDEHRRGEREQLGARSHHDVWSRLPRITCPTFVAAGRFDGIAPPENSEAIVSQIPTAELHLYEGGHLFILQDPAAFAEITAFLDVS